MLPGERATRSWPKASPKANTVPGLMSASGKQTAKRARLQAGCMPPRSTTRNPDFHAPDAERRAQEPEKRRIGNPLTVNQMRARSEAKAGLEEEQTTTKPIMGRPMPVEEHHANNKMPASGAAKRNMHINTQTVHPGLGRK